MNSTSKTKTQAGHLRRITLKYFDVSHPEFSAQQGFDFGNGARNSCA